MDCIASHNQWITDERNDWIDAIQNLIDVIDNENQIYNDTVIDAVIGREACESAAITVGAAGTALTVAAAVVAVLGTGGLAVVAGIIGGGSAVVTGVVALSGYDRCSKDFWSIVNPADDIRDVRIAGAELAVDSAEEQYKAALAAENTCITQCCSPTAP